MDLPAPPRAENATASEFDVLVVPEPFPLSSPASAGVQLQARAARLATAVEVLEAAAPGDSRTRWLRDACAALLRDLGTPEAPPPAAEEPRLEHALVRAEQTLLSIDADIPVGRLRRVLDALPTGSRHQLAGYARILAASLGDDVERRDRFEMLVTRMLTSVSESGGRIILETSSGARELISQVIGGRRLDPVERQTVLGVLAELRERVDALVTAEELFAGGLYADAYGYKLALHERILDFHVLYAVVGLNAAISNCLQAHGPMSARLRARAIAAHRAVRKTVEAMRAARSAHVEPVPGPYRLEDVRVVMADRGYKPVSTTRRREHSRAKAVLTALVLTAIPLVGAPRHASSGFRSVAEAEARQLPPWLRPAAVSTGGSALLGEVEPELWNHLDRAARERLAGELAEALAARNARSAVITSEGNMAIHIERGRVVYVR